MASSSSIPCPPRGIYVPAVAFFHPDETIDFDAIRAHLTRLAEGGVDGLVIQGSNGEAMHMLHDERQQVLRLARELTCGNMGKLQRVAHDPRIGRPFAAFAGKTDFFLHGLVGGSHGVIAATANLLPKAHAHMLRLYDEGRLKEAQELQTRFSRADWALVQLGIAGIKAALQKYYGYGGGRSRRPLSSAVDAKKLDGEVDAAVGGLVELENSL
ncbi:aldolase [Trichoderma citrinoviride]|uniref:Aldolase n=1 Tax=Trichoderma citrinoviride TaxID=58853 RepID=A0A2T4BFJ3_9HYPO|nr:aldolase [Trichoderma citrinoviride]PTB68097.1 aldolase [Trichoderma citrinoviride]